MSARVVVEDDRVVVVLDPEPDTAKAEDIAALHRRLDAND